MRRISSLLALLCVLAIPAALHADTITYTYTSGATPDDGTATAFSFSYTGTALLTDNGVPVTTVTCSVTAFATVKSCDEVLLDAHLTDQGRIKIFNGGEFFQDLPLSFFASVGTQTDSGGNTLTITDVASGSPVPEPGSIALLGTGMLGLAGVIRRRLSC